MNNIKTTSYKYGNDYQNRQVEKYKNRANNHWKHRVEIFKLLINQDILPKLEGREKSDIKVVDIGCSIGTFALEAARMGFDSSGIDFDNEAIKIAKQLAEEENVNAEFICGDISDSINFDKKIDIAVCFDIFEHLHDDELGAFLHIIKNRLSDNGVLLYHTFPTHYDYIFYTRWIVRFPLFLFTIFGRKFFEKIVKIYASKIDILLSLFIGKTYKEYIKNKSHCNPLTKQRLSDILLRAGFESKQIELAQLYDFKKKVQNVFKKHQISYRNLYGVAYPKNNTK